MPTIKEAKPHIRPLLDDLKRIDGVKDVFIWGSYARNVLKLSHRLLDIDVLVRTNFHSADLISIDNNIIKKSYSTDHLESQGYDPLAIYFSKEFEKLSKYNIDQWVISSDRQLLHWGPIIDIKNEAQKYVCKKMGITKNKIDKLSSDNRKN